MLLISILFYWHFYNPIQSLLLSLFSILFTILFSILFLILFLILFSILFSFFFLGFKTAPDECLQMELPLHYKLPFQLLRSNQSNTGYWRYTPYTPYTSNSSNKWAGEFIYIHFNYLGCILFSFLGNKSLLISVHFSHFTCFDK